MDCDTFSDYSFICGDMNYRINSTFTELTKNIESALDPKMDQLYLAMQ